MWNIILTDLVPIFVIMLLGYVSGKRNAFSKENARSFNKLVLNYALPAALFLSIVKGNRKMLFGDISLLLVSIVVIIGCYFLTYFICKKLFKRTKNEAAVAGLIGGAPTIGFLGFAVLQPIYGGSATTGLVVAIVAIVVNAIAIPIALMLLNPGDGKAAAATGTAGTTTAAVTDDKVGATNTTGATNAVNATNENNAAGTTVASGDDGPAKATAPKKVGAKHGNALLNALKEPVVWSPLLAVLLVICGVHFPKVFDPTFDLIAKANAGVAVFAAGLTLSANKFEFDKEVIFNTFIKLLIMPALFLLIGKLIGMESEKLQMLVLCGALPPVFSGVIIGSRFQTYVRTGTSSLAVSTLLFMATAPLWIWIARLVA